MHRDAEIGSERQAPDRLAEIVRSVAEAMSADGAGITLLRPQRRCVSVEATTSLVRAADRLQAKSGEGPCTIVGQSATTFSVDIAADPRWPNWGPAVAALGFCSLLAAQIRPDGQAIGVLTVYSAGPRSFSSDEAALTHLFARQAALLLVHK